MRRRAISCHSVSTTRCRGTISSRGSTATTRTATTARTSTSSARANRWYLPAVHERGSSARGDRRWGAVSRTRCAAAHLTGVDFKTEWDFAGSVLYNTVLCIDNPVGGFRSGATPVGASPEQGRTTDNYQFSGTATLL